MLELIQSLFRSAGPVMTLVGLAMVFFSVRSVRRAERRRLKSEQASAEALAEGMDRLARSSAKLQHRIALPRADYHGHPMPDDAKSPYEAEAPGDAGGPYGGSSAPPNSSATSYFHRLIAHGHNPLEAALIARGLGDIHFDDYYSPKQMLEVGMAWVMDRSFPREGPTWESKFWLGVKYRPTDQERTQWVHDAMRLIYPAWALEGVVPAISDQEPRR
jgi:hypothetical protein